MVLVTVNEGVLEGELVPNEFGQPFFSFKGIPYAQPPVGDLRFKAPQPPKSWKGVRSAKEFGSKCYQYDVISSKKVGSEDCLYLNVYTPEIKPVKTLPVMLWIHGGSLIFGSGENDFYGPEFLIREQVIIVTINYRLEVLGFLCLHSKEVPGNAGMKDQVAALRWVNQNISNFGGDPNNITIFGESAGGSSIAYHLVSPTTKGLFKRAIPQSGVSFCTWAQSYEPRDRALALARQLGCHSEDNKELYEFFKTHPVESLVAASVPILLSEKAKQSIDMYFSVVEEKEFGDQESFFTGDYESIHEDIDIMIGYTTDEAITTLGSIDDVKYKLEMARDFPEFFVSKPLALKLPVIQQLELGKKIRKYYFNDRHDFTGCWEELAKMSAMDKFIYPIMQFTKLCAKRNTVYLYRFSCKSERNIIKQLVPAGEVIGDKPVTSHADDMLYLFHFNVIPVKVDMNSETFRIVEKVVKLWTNFAKDGNPTPDDSFGVKWAQYNVEDQDFLDIGNELVAGTAPDAEEIQFWENLHREYGQKIY